MTEHAAISGSFADFKLVKTRSAAQIVVEVPIEEADRALAALGGLPQAGQERPVAVARMAVSGKQEAEPKEQPKERRSFHALPYSQQAAMVCEQATFQRYLEEEWPLQIWEDHEGNMDYAGTVRKLCGVNSRREFDTDDAAAICWRDLYSKFKAWEQMG